MEGTSLDDAFMYKPQEAVSEKPRVNQTNGLARNNPTTLESPQKNTYQSPLRQPNIHQPPTPPTPPTGQINNRSLQMHHGGVQPYIPTPVIYPNSLSIQKSASYFEALVNKRKDVIKMVSFAAIILLAISIHNVVDFGLKEFILSNELSFKQEIGIRLIYPLAVIFFLWNIKALFGR